MRRLVLLVLALLIILSLPCLADNIITVKWNQTGYYVKVYPLSNLPRFPNAILSIRYDLSHYKYASAVVTLGPTDVLLANASGLYILPGESSSPNPQLKIEPHICVNVTGKIYCNWGNAPLIINLNMATSEGGSITSGSVPIGGVGFAAPITVEEFVNICVVVAYQPLHTSATLPVISFQLYDPYTQKLIYSATWNNIEKKVICGVPPLLFINITYNDQWLGMYYISTVPSRGTFPTDLAPLACILVLSFFLCFALRNNPKRMGMGMIILGVLLTPLIAAFHLAGTGYYGLIAEGISAGLFILGVVLLLLAGRQAAW